MIVLIIVSAFGGGLIGWGMCSYHSHQRGKIAQLIAHIEMMEEDKGRKFTSVMGTTVTSSTKFPFSHGG